ncbi:MAG: transposase [Bacteroidetes bacterium]|nr:transposase [Bacteroidota bacterium]
MGIGAFTSKETILTCPKCNKIYKSQELKKLIPDGCNFGYDVLVHIGKAIFLKYGNEKEIQIELKNKNITISVSEITYLAKKFIVYLAMTHKESSPEIKKVICSQGGYILHVDAMCEGDSPHLMTALDEISNLVLGNVKIPTEKAEKIIPFFKEIKNTFGEPVAVVSDMGKGISNAIKTVFNGIPDYICHFHFLRDLGKDLFGKENDIIRNRLKYYGTQGLLKKKALQLKKVIDKYPNLLNTSINNLEEGIMEEWTLEYTPVVTVYTLIQWALAGKKEGNGYGFPFDRPYLSFYQRLQEIYEKCKLLQKKYLRGNPNDNKPFVKVCHILENTVNDETIKIASIQMQEKMIVYDKLREALRIAEPEENNGLNDDGNEENIKEIKQRVKKFRKWFVENKYSNKNLEYKKMLEQIDKYWEKLFADPITVETPHGKTTIQPQRTNNILERFFRNIRYGYRKKSGNNTMSKTLKAMLADTPLVKNLKNEKYLKIILNGKATLEERFAEIDAKIVRQEMNKSQDDFEKIPLKVKKIIKRPELPNTFLELFEKPINF